MLTGTERDMLERLERRAKHLTERIEKARLEGRALSFDEAELGALRWAIAKLGGEA